MNKDRLFSSMAKKNKIIRGIYVSWLFICFMIQLAELTQIEFYDTTKATSVAL